MVGGRRPSGRREEPPCSPLPSQSNPAPPVSCSFYKRKRKRKEEKKEWKEERMLRQKRKIQTQENPRRDREDKVAGRDIITSVIIPTHSYMHAYFVRYVHRFERIHNPSTAVHCTRRSSFRLSREVCNLENSSQGSAAHAKEAEKKREENIQATMHAVLADCTGKVLD